MRKIWSIPGGVHPPENKSQSMHQPLGTIGLPEQLILPLNQHIGAPAKPVVAVGDRVLTGQVIAEARGVVSAPVHASSSGTVVAIEDHTLAHPSGMSGPCIVIEPDGKDEWVELQACEDYLQLEREALLAKIRNAGIAGMGGAGFPAAVKLNPRADQKINTLIINGTECEPYITADDMLMQTRADELVAGTQLLAHLLGEPEEVIIGIEDNKPEAIAALQAATKAAAGKGILVEVASFPTKYPSGGEKQLIQILTGKEVPSGTIPASIGVVVQNVGSTVAAYRAVRFGEPLISRITTVVGEALETQRNIEVRLGTPIAHILATHGFTADNASRLVMGGPMMGFALQDSSVPVVKTTNCILAPSKAELPPPPPAQACIRCGMCAQACPASLLPQQLYWYAQAEDFEKLEAHNLADCIECGACSYVCPSNIPLVQYYRASKSSIRQAAIDKEKSDRSRARFEARQERIAKAEAEKEAKREARKKAAAEAKKKVDAQKASGVSTPASQKADIVAAAVARAQAKQASPEEQLAKLERALSSARNRLEKARERAANAEGEQKDKLEARAREAEVRVSDAQKKLEEYNASAGANKAPGNTASAPAEPAAGDPVAAAIERAKAKLALPPDEKLKANIESLQKRLGKAEEKLAAAKAEGSDTVDALQAGVDKLKGKISDAEKELASLTAATATQEQTAGEADAAGAAIERAKAKAAAQANMSAEEKLKMQIESLQARLQKAQAKLAKAEAEGDENVPAFRTAVEKLEAKLADTKAQAEIS